MINENLLQDIVQKHLPKAFVGYGQKGFMCQVHYSELCKIIEDYTAQQQVKVEPEVKPANGGQLSIRIFRDDNLQGFAAYHAQDENETKTILMNVYATFAASVENDIDAKEFIIQNLMHEFGHALEEYYQKEFDEDFIEKAVQSYFDKYHPDSRLSV